MSRLLSDLKSLGRGQEKVMTDNEMMLLSADLVDDPAFVVLREPTIKDIRTHPEKYVSKELLTYVRLLEHELVLQNPSRTFVRPEKRLVQRAMYKVAKFDEQIGFIHDVLEGLTEEARFRMHIVKDGVDHHFEVVLPEWSDVLCALIEHLEDEIVYHAPVKDIHDLKKQDAIVRLRKRMATVNRKNQQG